MGENISNQFFCHFRQKLSNVLEASDSNQGSAGHRGWPNVQSRPKKLIEKRRERFYWHKISVRTSSWRHRPTSLPTSIIKTVRETSPTLIRHRMIKKYLSPLTRTLLRASTKHPSQSPKIAQELFSLKCDTALLGNERCTVMLIPST